MNTILVTGASGFIGRALTAHLLGSGNHVIPLGSADGDIAEPETFAKLQSAPIAHVFHLAGRTFVPDSWKDAAGFHRVNTGGTLNVLEFCRMRNIALTHVSAYLYGDIGAVPIAEDFRLAPNNPYALSKYLAEQTCEFYARVHGVPVTVVRPFNVYGPGQNARFLIPSLVEQALGQEQLCVQDLKPRRDYLFVDDLVNLLQATRQPGAGYRVYNAGSGTSLSVADVVDAVQAAAGTSWPVHCRNAVRPQEISDTRADISRARNELQWAPAHSFAAGIAKVVAARRAMQGAAGN